MFDEFEGKHEISKQERHALEPQLRIDLLNAQFDLRSADFPVLVILAGDDGPACDETIDLLHEWMDARTMDTRVFLEPTEEERARPRFWRYWRTLPAKGQIGLQLGGWPLMAVADRVLGDLGRKGLERRLAVIKSFERTLAADGVLLVKFWFHLSKKEHKKRYKKARTAPKRRLHIDKRAKRLIERYDKLIPVAEHVVRDTDVASAPWVIIDGADRDYRDITVARTLLDVITRRMEAAGSPTTVVPSDPLTSKPLDDVDLSSSLEPEEYRERLERGQARLSRLIPRAVRAKSNAVLVFEGWDAAGKGGCIRRLTRAMRARDYEVVSVPAPTDEEKARHYLWRFWRRLPPAGRMILFDRSWYGRVLVERVEGFATEEEWRRAYGEINEFERQLTDHGGPVVKFWLHVDQDEQLRRFQDREKTLYKKYKITDEDYRNRDRWDDYVDAINEMVERTSKKRAPWHLVPANDKKFARIMILETVCDAIEKAL